MNCELYINGRFLTQPMTGVERYAYSVCRALVASASAIDAPRFVIVCPNAPVQPCYDTTGMTIVHYGFGNSHLWEQCVLPFFFFRKHNYVVVSFTGLGSILTRNKIMTIHDLSFLHNPSWFSKAYYWWYRLMTPLAVRTSRHIITVSQFSKQEILRFYPFLSDDRITVAYGAVDTARFHQLPRSSSPRATAPFALAVSSLDPRKNFPMLVKAFQGISGCQLRIVGSSNPVFSEDASQSSVSPHSQTTVQYLGRVSDDRLLELYNEALCFIFPSVYEGFGLPLLEAMSCGCPVLAADIPVFREVCGDAARYFNPHDAADIRASIESFLDSPDARKSAMRDAGLLTASRYSWQETARRILSLIHTIKP